MTLLLIGSDSLSLITAFAVAFILRTSTLFQDYLQEIQPLKTYLTALPFGILLLLLIFGVRGLYHPKQRLTHFGELYQIVLAVNFWFLLLMSGSYLTRYDYSRLIVILFWTFSLLFITTGRTLVRAIHQWHIRHGRHVTNVLIVGAGRPGKQVYEQLREYASLGYKIVGFVDDNAKHPEVIGMMHHLPSLIIDRVITEVYITDPSLSYETILTLVNDCPKRDVEFKIATNVFPLLSEVRGGLYLIDRIPSLNVRRSTTDIFYQLSKRFLDILAGSLLLVATLPLWAFIALLIKRDSLGPVFIIQERVGLNGTIFRMYKFRTMLAETPLYQEAPRNGQDTRITRVGQWLRKTSLDELPQLINILKGEMSLVGPRPEMPFIVEEYEPWQRKRLCVKPGLTGLWQILGRKDHPLTENLEYDFYYINNQSILLDLVILLKTIPLVIKRKGAF